MSSIINKQTLFILILIILSIFYFYGDKESDIQPKTELELEDEAHFDKYFTSVIEDEVNLFDLILKWEDQNKTTFGGPAWIGNAKDIFIYCSPKTKDIENKINERSKDTIGEINLTWSDRRCEIEKNIFEMNREYINIIKTMNDFPKEFYYFSYIDRNSEYPIIDRGFFLNLDDCEEYKNIYSNEFNYDTTNCKNPIPNTKIINLN